MTIDLTGQPRGIPEKYKEMKFYQDLNQYLYGFHKIKTQNGLIIFIIISKDLSIKLMML